MIRTAKGLLAADDEKMKKDIGNNFEYPHHVKGGESASGWFGKTMQRLMLLWDYLSTGVWSDTRRNWKLSVIKTLNLSVRSFLNGDIQTQACAMTYRTMLAVVPALALSLAIARGFGFQAVLQKELYTFFPGQKVAIGYALNFVDSYLNQASEGIFVGVGIVFLIYTMISLVGNVEDTFNHIWGVKEGRSIWRKVSDYTALLLILPILMICASGVTIMVSSTLNAIFKFSFMTPVITALLEFASWVLTWCFFAAAYMLIPNAKVKFRNAMISGVIAGTGFMVLQWIFVTGQMYVSRYNAIYGSFSFLPLFLIWMQLTWVICLSGAVLCYSSQNIFRFNFDKEVDSMSAVYRGQVIAGIAAVVVQRFVGNLPAAAPRLFIEDYGLPARIVSDVTDLLCRAGVLSRVVMDEKKEIYGFQPAVDPSALTMALLTEKIEQLGSKNFIPDFQANFSGVIEAFAKIDASIKKISDTILLTDLDIRMLGLDQGEQANRQTT